MEKADIEEPDNNFSIIAGNLEGFDMSYSETCMSH